MVVVNPFFNDKFFMFLWLRVKKGLTVGVFNISTISMVLCLFLLHLMQIFPKAHNFWKKTFVKHCLTVVEYFETTINTMFLTFTYYLTNCRTKHWLSKEGIIMWYDKIFVIFSHQWRRLTHFSITNLFCIYNYFFKKSVNRWLFLQFYFFNGLMLFFTLSNGDLSNDT